MKWKLSVGMIFSSCVRNCIAHESLFMLLIYVFTLPLDKRKVEENWKEGFFFSVLVLSGCAFVGNFSCLPLSLPSIGNRMDSKS